MDDSEEEEDAEKDWLEEERESAEIEIHDSHEVAYLHYNQECSDGLEAW